MDAANVPGDSFIEDDELTCGVAEADGAESDCSGPRLIFAGNEASACASFTLVTHLTAALGIRAVYATAQQYLKLGVG